MADNELSAQRAHDKRVLIGILTDINNQMRIIVIERTDLFRKEFRDHFPGPWREIESLLSKAANALENDEFNWEYVEGAGLVRDSLQFKRNMFTEAIKQNVVGRTLKIINSLLGSLSGVFPFLEAVKEYKEHIEAALAIQNRWR